MTFARSIIILFILSLFGTSAIAKTYITTIEPGHVYNKAAFKLWHNPDVKKIRGILMLNPGSNGDGRNLVDDKYWQDFANKHDFALLGTYLTDHKHPNMMIEHYIKVGEGSGKAILDAIDIFANESGHEELSYAPFLLWGHSAGGELNYEIASWIPERVIAFVVNQGGYYYSSVPSEETRQTPGLFLIGLKDLPSRNLMIKGMYLTNRRAGALWTLAEEQNVAHEVIGGRDLAIHFFEEVMKKRLSDNAIGYKALMPVTEKDGITGNIYNRQIENVDALEHSSWLVSESFANAWQEFVTKENN